MRAAIMASAWRTALGATSEQVWAGLIAGQVAARRNTHFDARSYAAQLAATIAEPPSLVRHRRFLRRMGLFAVEVAIEALAQAQVNGGERLGLFFAYGGLRAHWDDLMPAFQRQQPDAQAAWANGLNLLHPFWMLQHLSNNAQALTAEAVSAKGEGSTFAGANAGAQAITAAISALEAGVVDQALVVGYDSLVEPETLVELAERGVLNCQNQLPVAAPYSTAAQGFVAGEAAAALVLQRAADAKTGSWHIQAVAGADANQTEAQIPCVANLVSQLIQPGDLIDGAGLAQAEYDLAERQLLAGWLEPNSPLCCSLSALGQLGAAASVVQSIVLTEMLQRGLIPPIAGLQQAAAGPLLPLSQAQQTNATAAVAIAVGAPGLAGVVRVSQS